MDDEGDAADVVWGAAAIGKVIGLTQRQAFDKLLKGRLPGKKIGDVWVSSKKALLEAVRP